MREWLKQCNDYSDLQAIETHIYNNYDLQGTVSSWIQHTRIAQAML